MKETMPTTPSTSTLRHLLDEPLAHLLQESEAKLGGLVRTELGDSLSQAVQRTLEESEAKLAGLVRTELGDCLHQAVQRILEESEAKLAGLVRTELGGGLNRAVPRMLEESEAKLADLVRTELGGCLSEAVPRMLEEGEAKLAGQLRAELGDCLNQAVRRMRQAGDAPEVLATLLDAAGPYCEGAALLRVDGEEILASRARGAEEAAAERFGALEAPLKGAALAGAVESRDPVTAVWSPGQLSEELCALSAQAEEARASIFPVLSDRKVRALLVCWGTAQSGILELLAQTAGLSLPVEPPPPPPPPPPPLPPDPELIGIAPAPVATEVPARARPAWEDLPAEDQRTHLRAQRFARVQVSEIRLHHTDAVQAGRFHQDLYGALRDEIEAAREKFRASFMATCPSMVDYLHSELIRTLANDEVALMGSDYPGPLV
jgi:hypothetical protein